jgi:hypothetical protein
MSKKVGSGSANRCRSDRIRIKVTAGSGLPWGSPQGRKSGGGHGDPLLDVYKIDVHGGALEHAVDEGPLQALVLLLQQPRGQKYRRGKENRRGFKEGRLCTLYSSRGKENRRGCKKGRLSTLNSRRGKENRRGYKKGRLCTLYSSRGKENRRGCKKGRLSTLNSRRGKENRRGHKKGRLCTLHSI